MGRENNEGSEPTKDNRKHEASASLKLQTNPTGNSARSVQNHRRVLERMKVESVGGEKTNRRKSSRQDVVGPDCLPWVFAVLRDGISTDTGMLKLHKSGQIQQYPHRDGEWGTHSTLG